MPAAQSASCLHFPPNDVYLKTAADLAIALDITCDGTQTHTSLLLRGKPYVKFLYCGKEKHTRGLLMQLESQLDAIRATEDGQLMLNRLETYANEP